MVRFLVYTAILYFSLVHNVFCVQEDMLTLHGEMRPGALSGDCALVINRVRLADEPTWAPMAAWNGETWAPYRSQFGLAGSVLAAVRRMTGESPERVVAVGGAICGLMSAALLAAFFASIGSRIAPVAGHVGTLLTACSPPLMLFAPTVYWMLPALLAPFVFAWFVYPWATRSTGRMALFLTGTAALVCLKGLCGYEYISTVVAAPAAAIVFHRAAIGDAMRKWVAPVCAVGVAGTIGFGVSVALHVAQISAQTGEDGLRVVVERASARTARSTGDGTERVAYPVFAPEGLPEPVRCFANYFYQPILSSPQTWGRVRFLVPLGWLLGACGLASVVLWRSRRSAPAAAALVPAAAVALLAGVTWQALAVNHMVLHGHRNLIVYCVPFAPLAFALVGAAVARVGWPRLITTVAVLSVVGVVVGNIVALKTLAESSRELEAEAEGRARAVLQGEADAVPLSEKGPPPVTGLLPVEPTWLPSEVAFTGAYGPALTEPERPVGVYGWLRLPRERTARFPVSIIAVQGTEIVPTRVGLFRLAAVERLHGKQVACVAYRVVVPAQARPNEPLRLFAVPADLRAAVIELTPAGE